ncbi:MAG: nicotinate-nucleotide--dimethylbenzimidazole phosphoribosyltransferase [Rhodovibrionaceae bacterium]
MSDSTGEEPNFDEIRGLIARLPGPDLDAAGAAATRAAALRHRGDELGALAAHGEWLAAWQGRARPAVERPRIAVFAANHGVAARLPAPSWSTQDWVEDTVAGKTALNRIATELDADLRIYELALEQPSGDFTSGPALSEADCARAMAYGMMTVEEGFDLMVLGGFGWRNDLAARALAAALLGGAAEDWSEHEADSRLLAEGLERHRQASEDPLQALRRFGGLEMAAVAGAILACRLARLPVVLDGLTCLAAGAALRRLDPRLLDHCRAASDGGDIAARRLLEALQLPHLAALQSAQGSGIAGAAALPLLRAAARALDA